MAYLTAPRPRKLQAVNSVLRLCSGAALPAKARTTGAAAAGFRSWRPAIPVAVFYIETCDVQRCRPHLDRGRHLLRTQRVGILNHIGPAASRGPGREQHEPRGRKHPGREITA